MHDAAFTSTVARKTNSAVLQANEPKHFDAGKSNTLSYLFITMLQSPQLSNTSSIRTVCASVHCTARACVACRRRDQPTGFRDRLLAYFRCLIIYEHLIRRPSSVLWTRTVGLECKRRTDDNEELDVECLLDSALARFNESVIRAIRCPSSGLWTRTFSLECKPRTDDNEELDGDCLLDSALARFNESVIRRPGDVCGQLDGSHAARSRSADAAGGCSRPTAFLLFPVGYEGSRSLATAYSAVANSFPEVEFVAVDGTKMLIKTRLR
jgi:hypothetical protein